MRKKTVYSEDRQTMQLIKVGFLARAALDLPKLGIPNGLINSHVREN